MPSVFIMLLHIFCLCEHIFLHHIYSISYFMDYFCSLNFPSLSFGRFYECHFLGLPLPLNSFFFHTLVLLLNPHLFATWLIHFNVPFSDCPLLFVFSPYSLSIHLFCTASFLILLNMLLKYHISIFCLLSSPYNSGQKHSFIHRHFHFFQQSFLRKQTAYYLSISIYNLSISICKS